MRSAKRELCDMSLLEMAPKNPGCCLTRGRRRRRGESARLLHLADTMAQFPGVFADCVSNYWNTQFHSVRLSQKQSDGDILGTKRGIIDPLL